MTNDYNNLSVFLLFIVPALGGLLFGYEIGVTSAAVDQVSCGPPVIGPPEQASGGVADIFWYVLASSHPLTRSPPPPTYHSGR